LSDLRIHSPIASLCKTDCGTWTTEVIGNNVEARYYRQLK